MSLTNQVLGDRQKKKIKLCDGIGNTPMIKICYTYGGKKQAIYVKLESYNITGSIKDRVAWYILQSAIERKELRVGMPIVEATSGNTGIALAALGAHLGHPVIIFMPDWASKERVQLMQSYGAEIHLISKEQGGFIKCVQEAKTFAKKTGGFLANQFENRDNFLAHYETTGAEIIKQIPKNKKIAAFVSGIGTGGTLMGTGVRLKEVFKDMWITALEPEKMPLLSGGKVLGQHKIEGIGDDFIPALVQKEKIDKLVLIDDEDAINMARKLSRELGLGVGISSGANFLASVKVQSLLEEQENGYGKGKNVKKGKEQEGIVVTVFADDQKKYLSTDLSKPICTDSQLLSNQIKLEEIQKK